MTGLRGFGHVVQVDECIVGQDANADKRNVRRVTNLRDGTSFHLFARRAVSFVQEFHVVERLKPRVARADCAAYDVKFPVAIGDGKGNAEQRRVGKIFFERLKNARRLVVSVSAAHFLLGEVDAFAQSSVIRSHGSVIENFRADDNVTDFSVSTYFTNQGLLREGQDGSFDDYKFEMIRQNIVTYHGDENLISMVKLNGATDPGADTVNSTGARMFGRDIFDNAASGNEPSGTAMLNELLCMCEKVHTCDTLWMSSDGVTTSDVAHATMVLEETRIGARQQLYNSVDTMLVKQSENITEDITNVSGTDIAELATKLMQLTTLYNLSLSMGGRILPQSLADYL